MTALLTASLPEYLDEPVRPGPTRSLRLRAGARAHGAAGLRPTEDGGRTRTPVRAVRRGVGSRPRCGVAAPSWR